MPVELRKRKAPPPPPEPAPKKQQSKVSKAATKVKEAVKGGTNGSSKTPVPVVGDTITLDGFGGDIKTHEGTETNLKSLVDQSKSGVVIFTYPKASTPGCTNQVCFFRDSYEPLTKGGLAIYGMSTDSPKANTNFKEKKELPYPLLCDTSATLLGALGLKSAKGSASRGVFVVDKTGKVLLLETGSPKGTLEAVEKIVEETGETTGDKTDEAEDEAKPENGAAIADKDKGDEKKTEEEGKEEEKTEDAA